MKNVAGITVICEEINSITVISYSCAPSQNIKFSKFKKVNAEANHEPFKLLGLEIIKNLKNKNE